MGDTLKLESTLGTTFDSGKNGLVVTVPPKAPKPKDGPPHQGKVDCCVSGSTNTGLCRSLSRYGYGTATHEDNYLYRVHFEDGSTREQMRNYQKIQLNKKAQISWAGIIGSLVLLGVFACGTVIQQNDGVSKASLRSANVFVQARGDNMNAQLGTKLFTNISIQSEKALLDLKVSDIWYTTPDSIQDELVDEWMGAWMTIAGEKGWTGLARIQFKDSAGEQVAYKSGTISN